MSDAEKFRIVKNDETGAEIYQCNLCESKFGTKKSVKTHVTAKHKGKKMIGDKPEDTKETVADEEYVFDDLVQSTQTGKGITAEEIANFYESGDANEFLKETDLLENTSTANTLLSENTINRIVDDMNEEEGDKSKEETETVSEKDKEDDLITENMLLKSQPLCKSRDHDHIHYHT